MIPGWTLGTLRSTGTAAGHEVLKLGGSLLGMPDWPRLVAGLIRGRAAGRPVIVVVGGGAVVDGLRTIDAAAPADSGTMHDLAIGLMGTTARLVSARLSLPLAGECPCTSAAVLDVPRWLAASEQGRHLPAGWHVTSDSIAAHVAAVTGGDLLLGKRAPPPFPCADDPLGALVESGWVDGYFPAAAGPLGRIGWAVPASVPAPALDGPAGQRSGPRGR
ncbi:MAG: hypothetical protein EBZ74_07725 [Planctomycetia bacterium]|nr:hypothetical protein [Planctomycetia bacterium]